MNFPTPIVVTAGESPLDKDEVKEFCGIGFDDDDTTVETMIATAFDWLQPPTGCLAHSIVAQTLCFDLPFWVGSGKLPCGPVTAITSIKYFDENNTEQTLDAANYFLDRDTLMFKDTFSAPSLYRRPGAVRITYTAGMSELPPKLKMAMLRIVKQLYDYRDELIERVTFDPDVFGVGALILPYRVR